MKLESFFCNWKISSSFPTSKIFANFTETFQLQQSLFNFGSNFPISNFLTSHFFNRPFQLHVSQSNPLIVMDTKFQIFGVRFSNGSRFVDSFFSIYERDVLFLVPHVKNKNQVFSIQYYIRYFVGTLVDRHDIHHVQVCSSHYQVL